MLRSTIPNKSIRHCKRILESNQTLAWFKFRNWKQAVGQSCDAYMSQLRLPLPKSKYKHNSDELLKDQFTFGLQFGEIQDQLLGEIYWNTESKLGQRKLLGVLALSVDAIKTGKKNGEICNCKYCEWAHDKGACPAYGKPWNRCGKKNHFEKNCSQIMPMLN